MFLKSKIRSRTDPSPQYSDLYLGSPWCWILPWDPGQKPPTAATPQLSLGTFFFWASGYLRGAAPPPPCISALSDILGTAGAWEERGVLHHPALVFNLDHWGSPGPEGEVFPEAQRQAKTLSCPVLGPQVLPGLGLMAGSTGWVCGQGGLL